MLIDYRASILPLIIVSLLYNIYFTKKFIAYKLRTSTLIIVLIPIYELLTVDYESTTAYFRQGTHPRVPRWQ